MASSLGTAELARLVAAILEKTERGLLGAHGPGSTVGSILSWLERDDLSPDQVKDLLERLRQSGHLARFLNLVSNRRFRTYLRAKEVPWVYVLTHWEPTVRDTGIFFGGFAVGAGESLVLVLKLAVSIIGAPFSAELAAERDKFWQSVKFLASPEFLLLMREFADSPAEYAGLAVDHLVQGFEERLWNLEFYEAGRQLGFLVASVLSVAGALRRLPGLLKNLAGLLRVIPRISVDDILALGVPLRRLKDFLARPLPQLVTPEGFIFATAGDEVALLDKAARPLGKFSLSRAVQDLASGQPAAKPTVVLGRISLLPRAAQNWLREVKLYDQAAAVLKAGGPEVRVIMDAIRAMHGMKNFNLVLRSALWGMRGTSRVRLNARKGALHVMRYVLKNFRHVDPKLVAFELHPGSGIWRRWIDVTVFGLGRYEFKSVQGLSGKLIKQLVRDIIRERRDLKVLHLVFERGALLGSERALVDALKLELRKVRWVSPRPPYKTFKPFDPFPADLDKAIERMVEFF
jgi:hypothetical protein